MPNEPPAEIKAVIDRLLGGFNSKNPLQYKSAFSDDAVVVDGMAPYRWTGENAPSRWFADAEIWAHELGVTNEKIACEEVIHAETKGASAYVVISATLSFNLKDRPASRRGVLTFTFAQQGGEWKVEAQAWGRLS